MLDCAWFSENFLNCKEKFVGTDGKNPIQACCGCGGGIQVEITSSKSDVSCRDQPSNWYTGDSEMYNCPYWVENGLCARFGHYQGNDGKTAAEACCGCGGGVGKQ